ncbi:MAG: TIM barrel protein [Chloroflexi bacterium]|nr:TIM barrel protein [Chloroflexota bacterium]MBM3174380.1 TIM barrel protein [Chloroflexota bacterium]
MEKLLFGPAGVPLSARARSTVAGIERVAELGLGCMELEFVQGVKMSRETALTVAEVAYSKKISLSAHGPYFINLNASEPEKLKASQERIFQTARIASLCGATSIVFHAAFYMGEPPSQVYDKVKKQLQQITGQLKTEGNRVWVRPEVTGKTSQFGTLEEVLDLSAEVEGVAPCIDFAHWHARSGKLNSYDEFIFILKQVENKLGRQALDNMHIHVSGIAYGKSGETKHLNLRESDFNYVEFIHALRDYKVKGLVIAESPNLEEDTLLLQQTYKATGQH